MIRELRARLALLKDRYFHNRLRRRYPTGVPVPYDVGTAIESRVAGLLRALGRTPLSLTVSGRVRLDPQDTEHATWRLTLETDDEVSQPLPGDMLYVRWRNRPQLVSQVLNLLDARGDEPVTLSTESSMFGPGSRVSLSLREALEQHVELEEAAPPILRRAGFRQEARHNENETRRHDRYHHAVLRRRDWNMPHPLLEPVRLYLPSVLEYLVAERGLRVPTPQQFVDSQSRISGRPYTMSGFQQKDETRTVIEITVSQVEKEITTAGGDRVTLPARTSSYLARVAPGEQVAAWVLPELHRFPVSLGRNVPTIVICTGSGVSAPLSLLRSGAVGGPLWLIYGVRSWERKSLYGEELSRYAAEGLITRLDVAVSRPLAGEGPARRVQQVLREVQADLADWLRDGAHVYLSGRLSMGREVGELFEELLVEQRLAASPDAARALLDDWRQSLRFQASVSGV